MISIILISNNILGEHAGMQRSEVEWLSLMNNPCGLHSWGSVKVAGHVFFVSLRIHAGGRVAVACVSFADIPCGEGRMPDCQDGKVIS